MVDVHDRPRQLLIRTEEDDEPCSCDGPRCWRGTVSPDSTRCSIPSTRRRLAGWASGCSSAAPSSRDITAACGPSRTRAAWRDVLVLHSTRHGSHGGRSPVRRIRVPLWARGNHQSPIDRGCRVARGTAIPIVYHDGHRRSAHGHVHTDTKVRWTTQAVASMLAHTVTAVVTAVVTLCGASLYMAPSPDEVWSALAFGAVPSVGLLVGAIAGSLPRMPHQRIAIAMSVGAGLLLAGVSLKLAADAIGLPARWQRRWHCCLGQPCSARATRFSRGSCDASEAMRRVRAATGRVAAARQRRRHRARQRA